MRCATSLHRFVKRRRLLVFALPLLLPLEGPAEAPSPRVLERYREMLRAQPVDGTALDRLWKAYTEGGRTAELLQEYEGANGGHIDHRPISVRIHFEFS